MPKKTGWEGSMGLILAGASESSTRWCQRRLRNIPLSRERIHSVRTVNHNALLVSWLMHADIVKVK